MKSVLALGFGLVLVLAACKEDDEVPGPLVMTDEILGHYCQMYIADHAGPKAQVFLEDYSEPVWFSQVSDAGVFRHDAERPAPIKVVYVSDMSAATSWQAPGAENWIAADKAWFVIDSMQAGGMGLPEAVPFGREADAVAFTAEHGGRVVGWNEIPEGYARMAGGMAAVPVEAGETAHEHGTAPHDAGRTTQGEGAL